MGIVSHFKQEAYIRSISPTIADDLSPWLLHPYNSDWPPQDPDVYQRLNSLAMKYLDRQVFSYPFSI